ncbi:MAG TPA: ATP-binding protein [Terriglobales bacterium]|nr:ATP-binding protein [Terriglobales bacterium]
MKSSVFFKLLGAFLLVILAVTVILDLEIREQWKKSLRSELEESLQQETRQFALRVDNDSAHSPVQIANETAAATAARATIIDRTGKVLADSEADPATMENHAHRPEFAAALNGNPGEASRTSKTLGIDFLYTASPTQNGAVRLAYPLAAIHGNSVEIERSLFRGSLFAFLIAVILAAAAAELISRRLQRIVNFAERVAAGNLSARIDVESTDEIARVAMALNTTAERLEQSFAEVESSRQQLEAVLNSMQAPVIAVNQDERIEWVNGAMNRLLPNRVRLHAPLLETLREPDLLFSVRETIKTRHIHTTRARVLPGRTYEATIAPMLAHSAVVLLHDLTEVERVEKTRRDFIANVSHELRTPLTSIQGYAETLLDLEPSEGGAHEFLEIIRKNALRMSRLTEDLLTLARVESGEQRFRIQQTPASQLIREAQQYFAEMAHLQGSELSIELKQDAMVGADPEAVHQVFSNLISNAVKYCPPGTPIVIGAHQREDEMEFFVRDSGPGIASEHLSRLFQRFYRVDKARSRESGGTGLGLAIVKHIVMAHGGSVRVESELNHGSSFFFTLPKAQSRVVSAETTEPHPIRS